VCGNESLQQQTRAMRLLGLAKRAGAVSSGVEGVRSLCRSGRAGVVLVAKERLIHTVLSSFFDGNEKLKLRDGV